MWVMPTPLPREFYDRDPVCVAQELLGKLLVRRHKEGTTSGVIVEVEAYLARDDPANHAFRGRTRRNASMFGPPGHAYVYAIHSRWCLNAVTEPVGTASAVLIRAVEPRSGIEQMKQRRGTAVVRDLARGPGRLCEAFAIDRELDGCDLTRRGPLWIEPTQREAGGAVGIERATRVGVTSAEDLPLRFFIRGSPYVSKPGRRQSGAPNPQA